MRIIQKVLFDSTTTVLSSDDQMAHWKEEYTAALAARDRREKANIALYNACMILPRWH